MKSPAVSQFIIKEEVKLFKKKEEVEYEEAEQRMESKRKEKLWNRQIEETETRYKEQRPESHCSKEEEQVLQATIYPSFQVQIKDSKVI